MSSFVEIFHAIMLISVLPLVFLSYIGTCSIIEEKLSSLEFFYRHWIELEKTISQEEMSKLVRGQYPFKVTKRILDPEHTYYEKRKRLLSSGLLDSLIAWIHFLVGVLYFLKIAYANVGVY